MYMRLITLEPSLPDDPDPGKGLWFSLHRFFVSGKTVSLNREITLSQAFKLKSETFASSGG